ncbi:4-hydroxybenzoate octaprenyltransferase [Alphaproteobacteria bacterium]|nr:4-hydroxybenzoate octaprenyltransferase [Alphaproteobacteria bacterium]
MLLKIKQFIILGRFHSPTGALLLAWPCTWGIAMAKPDLIYLICFSLMLIIGSFIMRAAGCAWNDILDRHIDKKTSRTKNRPIAAGKLSINEGIVFIFIMLSIGFLILINLSIPAIIISLISIPLIIIYPLTKRVTFFPQVWLGITFNIGILVGYSCVSESYPNTSVILLYIGAIFWTIGYDTLYAMQDYNDDLLTGVKSTAVKMHKYSGVFAAASYIICTIIFCTALMLNNLETLSIIIIIILGIWQVLHAMQTKINDTRKFITGFNKSNICGFYIWVVMIVDLYMLN